MSTIDLNTPPPNHEFKVTVSREETSGERAVRLTKDLTLFFAALVFVSVIVLLCYNTLVSSTTTAEEKKWAMSVLTLAAGGLIGYLVRK